MFMDADNIKPSVRALELFQGLEPGDIDRIFARGMTIRVAKDEVLFYQGTIGGQMYAVLSGRVGVFNNEDICLAQLGPGEMFGEMALVNKEPRNATVKALEESHLFVLSESTFDKLLTKRASIRVLLNIIRSLSRRLRVADINLGNYQGS
jgi:CRP-like cAMP-binding protein